MSNGVNNNLVRSYDIKEIRKSVDHNSITINFILLTRILGYLHAGCNISSNHLIEITYQRIHDMLAKQKSRGMKYCPNWLTRSDFLLCHLKNMFTELINVTVQAFNIFISFLKCIKHKIIEYYQDSILTYCEKFQILVYQICTDMCIFNEDDSLKKIPHYEDVNYKKWWNYK